jgi:hypothetical protein
MEHATDRRWFAPCAIRCSGIQYLSSHSSWFNYDRSQTIASIDRIKKLAANTKGTLIIQHDARDIEKLPAFPAAGK